MKTLIQSLIAIMLIAMFSCRSVDKLVEQGRYDDAIDLAAKKLAGKDKKKTKHVKALEKAFAKVNKSDMRLIDNLRDRNADDQWDRVYDVAIKIENRQNRIDAFLPLISENGYEASFDFVNTKNIKSEAANLASQYHYNHGLQLLDAAVADENRILAREAYYQLGSIDRYNSNYRDARLLLDRAMNLGTANVLITLDQSVYDFLPLDIPDKIIDRVKIPNKDWTTFYFDHDTTVVMDAITKLVIHDVRFSPEQEQIRLYSENIAIKSDDANTQVDSLGNVIKPVTETAPLQFEEITRNKTIEIVGDIELVDFATGNIIERQRVTFTDEFYNRSISHRGDNRAVNTLYRQPRVEYIAAFPSDLDMLYDGAESIKGRLNRYLKSLKWSDAVAKK